MTVLIVKAETRPQSLPVIAIAIGLSISIFVAVLNSSMSEVWNWIAAVLIIPVAFSKWIFRLRKIDASS